LSRLSSEGRIANGAKLKHTKHIYKDIVNIPRHITETAAMALYLPSAFGRVGKRGKPIKADEICGDFVSRYPDDNIYPTDVVKSWRYANKMQYRQDRLKGDQ
ncbi:MAG: hypothetical protein ACKPKO_26540, partial [Candidatus Fonsibacter sp.]